MRLNEHTTLTCQSLSLVPYTHDLVARYHTWMLDEEIQALTASEPLTLAQEYEMQASWQQDEDSMSRNYSE